MTRQIAFLIAVAAALAQDPFSQQRDAMVRDHLEARGIRNPDVLRVMRATQRHLFVPAGMRAMSYADHPLPIGHDATISQPYIVALMTELLEPSAKQRVLEIGTGSGYQAAVLSPLVHKVFTIEIVPELAKSARETLARLGYNNVTVRQGDGFAGWPEEAPFDRVILTAAPQDVPATLINQLANNGRLVAPIGPAGAQELIVITKDAKGKTRRQTAGRVAFVPMKPATPTRR
jgi:protein-L-isoaspartate(D-aspartate) O-methyltransferase